MAWLAACAPSYKNSIKGDSAYVPTTLTQEQKTAVQSGVKLDLKDPESARFGLMVAASHPNKSSMVCGMVNAKNSYGGYTGDRPYFGLLISGNRFVVINIGSRQSSADVAFETCKKNGLSLI